MSWEKSLEALQSYISDHPCIEITRNVMVIPQEVRGQFYRLFDAIRSEFVSERLSWQLCDARALSANWKDALRDLNQNTCIKNVRINGSLNWFLDNPLDGLSRSIFDSLFKLLKKEIELPAFEKQAADMVQRDYDRYFEEMYKRWATIELVNLLKPESLHTVISRDFYDDPTLSEGDIGPGLREEAVPDPVATDEISFEHGLFCSFLTPHIILKSRGRYYSLRPDFIEARWKARYLNPEQEWLDIRRCKTTSSKAICAATSPSIHRKD
jgi:hypothetical protein